ncbi:hypothetical protein QJS10_CPA09g00978 [Acorus calamus]|uniref:Uncharacterized protein n=1 Tax=Acorus calamus TaxID=4465 RepID=A0AAV9E3W3_ACOCL|nr:hypothetical protein QJS10_CPA09g00978 [Acorus calamus]
MDAFGSYGIPNRSNSLLFDTLLNSSTVWPLQLRINLPIILLPSMEQMIHLTGNCYGKTFALCLSRLGLLNGSLAVTLMK